MTATKARGDGSGSLYRRADGKWVAQVRVYDEFTGKSRKVRRYASSRDAGRELLKELREGATVPATTKGITFGDYLRTWTAVNLPRLEIADSTKRIYGDCLTRYGVPAAGSVSLTALTPTLAEEWVSRVAATRRAVQVRRDGVTVSERKGPPIAATTVRNTFTAAVRALDTAVRDGIIATNPLRAIDRPRAPRVQVPVTGPDEVDRLLTACEGRRIGPLVHFVAFTGCRIGEALSITWADVDLDAGAATIRRSGVGAATTKGGRVRTVTLLPIVVEQLRAQRARQRTERLALGAGWSNPGGLVFTSATGRTLDRHNVTHELQRALRAAGVDQARPWHSLRHGAAHRLIAGGAPLHLVSAVLGHSGIGITNDLYGHVDSRVPADVLAAAWNAR